MSAVVEPTTSANSTTACGDSGCTKTQASGCLTLRHNIQHRKGAQDAKRGKIFTKLIKEIVIAAKAGGGVIENNPSLRMVIDKALAANMKRDTIESAVKRGSGDLDGDNYEEVRYEGYGLGGTAIMVDTLTDNRNRTVADVRHAFSKHGGNLGTDGSVAYLFNKQGFISFSSLTSF
jgi:YebC/PmpR family DNA-binding regulatory protein